VDQVRAVTPAATVPGGHAHKRGQSDRAVAAPVLSLGVEGERDEQRRIDPGANHQQNLPRLGQIGRGQPEGDQDHAHDDVVEVGLAQAGNGLDAAAPERVRVVHRERDHEPGDGAERQLHRAGLCDPRDVAQAPYLRRLNWLITVGAQSPHACSFSPACLASTWLALEKILGSYLV